MNWDQLAALIELRWRLSRNQWRRTKGLDAALASLGVALGLGAAVVGGMTGLAVGFFGMRDLAPRSLGMAWSVGAIGFFVLWIIGLFSELQRADPLDPAKLAHLPVSPRDVFLMNYVASHVSLTLAFAAPLLFGVVAGMALGRQWLMALLFPAVAAFFFMITAWTQVLRNWLARMATNPRKRQMMITVITIAFIMLFQLPYMLGSLEARSRNAGPAGSTAARATRAAVGAVPLFWLPEAVAALGDGRVGRAVAATAGMAGLGAAGLALAWRSARRLHTHGDTARGRRRAERRERAAEGARAGKRWMEWRIPWVRDEASAVAATTLRCILRAPEVRIAAVANMVPLFFFGMLFLRRAHKMSATADMFLPAISVAAVSLILVAYFTNQFGMDRDGFRSFVLAPASRRDVLAGKNLSWLFPGLTLLAIMLGVIMAGRGMSAWGIAEALILFGAAFLLMAAAGNFASVLWPLRIASGAAKRSVTPTHVVMQMVFIMAFPIAVAPVFAPALVKLLAAQASADLANLAGVVVAAGVLGFAVVVYVLALGPAARLLERRERSVLETLTREVN